MAKFGFPTPQGDPTELEEAMSHWKNDDVKQDKAIYWKILTTHIQTTIGSRWVLTA